VDEDSLLRYLESRYQYSRDEVKEEVFEAVENAVLNDQPSPETSELKLLLPHLIRSHMNIYSQIKRGSEARYITIREVLVEQMRQYPNNLALFANPPQRQIIKQITRRLIPEQATIVADDIMKLEKLLQSFPAVSPPSTRPWAL